MWGGACCLELHEQKVWVVEEAMKRGVLEHLLESKTREANMET